MVESSWRYRHRGFVGRTSTHPSDSALIPVTPPIVAKPKMLEAAEPVPTESPSQLVFQANHLAP